MKLQDYLKQNKIYVNAFAKQLGVNRSAMYHWFRKRGYPSASIAKKIIFMTNKAVTYEDLFE